MKFKGPWFKLATARYHLHLLFALGYVDSFFLAAPVTSVFILLLARKEINPSRCFFSVLAGILAGSASGYALGHLVLMSGEDWLTGTAQHIMDKNAGFSVNLYYKIRNLYLSKGFLVMLTGAFTPVPYGVFSISAGLLKSNFILFLAVTLAGHSFKYLLIGFVTRRSRILLEFARKPETRIIRQSEA